MRTDIPLREITIEEIYQEVQRLKNELLTHNHLTSGSQILTGEVSGILQSPNFVSGSSGWQILPTGSCEFNTGTFRGTINATAGYFGDATNGVDISANGLTLTGTGYIRTAASGQRIRMKSGYIESFDSNSKLRFRLQTNTLEWSSSNEVQAGYIDNGPTATAEELWLNGKDNLYFRQVTGVGDIVFRFANTDHAKIEPNNFTMGDLTQAGKSYIHIKGDDDSDNDPGCLVLYAHNGTPYYLWVDNTGDLRIHTSAPTDEDVDGVVVGTQA